MSDDELVLVTAVGAWIVARLLLLARARLARVIAVTQKRALASEQAGMREILIGLFALGWLALATAAAAAPGMGFGRNATGGAGYPVVEVTTLADNAQGAPVIPGSLRAALSGGNRIVRFRVSGNIRLTHRLVVRGPNVTIDGRGAPNRGVALWDNALVLPGTTSIVRFIRFRGNSRAAQHQGLEIAGGAERADRPRLVQLGDRRVHRDRRLRPHGARPPCHDPVLADRRGSRGPAVRNLRDTGRWRRERRHLLPERLRQEHQPESADHHGPPEEGYGGGAPRSSGEGRYELIDNVVYDAIYGTRLSNQSPAWTIRLDAIGNLWLAGPRAPNPKIPIMVFSYPPSQGSSRFFLENNFGPHRNIRTGQPCDYFSRESVNAPCAGWAPQHNAAQRQVSQYLLPAGGAPGNLEGILAAVGARRPCRDSADKRVIDELIAGTSSVVTLPQALPNLSLSCP